MKTRHRPHRGHNIQRLIFMIYMGSISVLLVIASVLLSVRQYRTIRQTTDSEMSMNVSVIADHIDLNIRQMDSVALNTIHSTTIKDTFTKWANGLYQNAFEEYKLQNTITNALFTFRGADSSVRQINLYALNGVSFGAGNYIGSYPDDFSEDPRYEATIRSRGRRYLDSGINPLASRTTGTSEDRMYFSLYRLYYNELNIPTGIVEIQEYYDVMFDDVSSTNTSYPVNVYVYDETGRLLYPLAEEDEAAPFDYYAAMQEVPGEQFQMITNSDTGNREYLCRTESSYSDLTIVMTASYADFMAPIRNNVLTMLALITLAFLFCWMSAILVSRLIGTPLTNMYRAIAKVSLDDSIDQIELPNTGILEIDSLKNSLNNSLRFQKDATQTLLVLKEQEVQAQMLALQAQMNPHFLYNSLNTISAMAEEGLTEPIAQMCQDITSILRYISSSKDQLSSLEEELENCSLYLKCIKLRYNDLLQYSFDIPDEMLDLQIPKLCVQMLIENSVKYTTRAVSPWKIQIIGHIDENEWYVDVIDNGIGFRDDVSERLKSQMDFILENGLLPSLELDGMGILNIFIRFYLIYGISFIFDFYNLPEGGALVRIGGRFDEKNKPL